MLLSSCRKSTRVSVPGESLQIELFLLSRADFAELKHSSISFFDIEHHETAISRWFRAKTRAAKVGKGLSKNDKAQKLALQHWLECDNIEVLDEPLYAHFLRVTGVTRPYREKVLSSMEADGDKVMKEVIFAPGKKQYRFYKHMAKQHLPGLKDDLMKKGKHFILIRNPLDVLASFEKVVPPTFLEIGLAELVAIYSELCGLGKALPIIDAAELQKDLEGTLRGLCQDLGIPFQPSMLKWEAGPKAVDGVWAPWWYGSVHKSTCFSSANKYPKPFPSSLYDLLEH